MSRLSVSAQAPVDDAQVTPVNPIEQLLVEHDAFRGMCDELQTLIDVWKSEGYLAAITAKEYALLLKCRETIREHLNVHLVKEEEVFFPRLEKLVPQGRVKFLFLNYDHEYLREYFDDFSLSITLYEEDHLPMHRAIERIILSGVRIIDNLLQHILAEDTVYFELAHSGLSPEDLAEMGREMHELELRLREN
jgi:hemerythrin-like domain-containing protein